MAKKRKKEPCRKCPRRDHCRAICAHLENNLRRVTRYLRETPLPPRDLELLAERADQGRWEEWLVDEALLRKGDLKFLLTPRQAELVRLVFWRQLSVAEAGDQLGIHRSTAVRRYHNALERLRRRLAHWEEDPDGLEEDAIFPN